MKSTAKAAALLRDIADKLKIRQAGSAGVNSVRAANDANGWPMLILSRNGNEAESQPVIAVRISAVNAISKDIFGNDLVAFAPHILEVAYELGLISGQDLDPARADLFTVLFECTKTGCRMQIKEIANGTAVSEAAMNAAAAISDMEDLYYPAKSV